MTASRFVLQFLLVHVLPGVGSNPGLALAREEALVRTPPWSGEGILLPARSAPDRLFVQPCRTFQGIAQTGAASTRARRR